MMCIPQLHAGPVIEFKSSNRTLTCVCRLWWRRCGAWRLRRFTPLMYHSCTLARWLTSNFKFKLAQGLVAEVLRSICVPSLLAASMVQFIFNLI